MKETLYYRCLKVINSCTTVEQVKVAERYISNLQRVGILLPYLQIAFLCQLLKEKYFELEPGRLT